MGAASVPPTFDLESLTPCSRRACAAHLACEKNVRWSVRFSYSMPTFAAIDIGSNSVRLKISRLHGGRLKAIHEDREVTRLGEGVFSGGLLSPEAMSDTVRVLQRVPSRQRRNAARSQSERWPRRRCAMPAIRAHSWSGCARRRAGAIEIVSGLEEARLIHLGSGGAGRVGAHSVLLVDLGGGSCEVTLSRHGHLRDTVSLPLGAVRLTGEFLIHDPPRKSELKRLHEFVAREIARIEERVKPARVGAVIATSGTAAALVAAARNLARPKKRRPTTYATREMIRRIAREIARLSLEQRQKVPGIGPRRAEIICAGAFVYAELLEQCHLRGFRYSALGLRDGVLAQMATEYDRSTRSGRAIESERWESIKRAVEHYLRRPEPRFACSRLGPDAVFFLEIGAPTSH